MGLTALASQGSPSDCPIDSARTGLGTAGALGMFRSCPGDPGAWPGSGIPRLSQRLHTEPCPHCNKTRVPGKLPAPNLFPQPRVRDPRRRGALRPPVCAVPLGKSAHTLGPEAQGPHLALNIKLLLTPYHLVQPGRLASQAAGWKNRGARLRSTDLGDWQVTSHSWWAEVDPGPQRPPHPPGQAPETRMPPICLGQLSDPLGSSPSHRRFLGRGATGPPGRRAEGSTGAQLRVCRGGKPTEPPVCF